MDKYDLPCTKHLHSYRLKKQDGIKYDSREPPIRCKAKYAVLETLAWWEVPRRWYSKSWKQRSKLKNQYMINRVDFT